MQCEILVTLAMTLTKDLGLSDKCVLSPRSVPAGYFKYLHKI